ncbi:hypothetical protein C8Q70DRAFT_20006 [Cubamyces menziesii]|nr:hypothetical protein C8Q70DRAFT_20006 [Cubamyces menziesii]
MHLLSDSYAVHGDSTCVALACCVDNAKDASTSLEDIATVESTACTARINVARSWILRCLCVPVPQRAPWRNLSRTSMRHRHTQDDSDSEVQDSPQPHWITKVVLPERSEPAPRPSRAAGYALLAGALLFLLAASYAVFFSAFLPRTGIWVLDALAEDRHYKYLVVTLVPTSTWFVIANWVGWQYYRNS